MPRTFTPAGSIDNIKRVYLSATAKQVSDGLRWYAEFRSNAFKVASMAGWTNPDLSMLAAIVAAFSPQRNPNVNLKHALDFIRSKVDPTYRHKSKCFHTPQQDAKAERIWSGENPADVLTGPKESAFYRNIAGNGDSVTIDGHAWCIWIGEYITTDKVSVPASGPQRRQCEADYLQAAIDLGVRPCDLQAITWVAWRDQNQTDRTKSMRTYGGDHATIA